MKIMLASAILVCAPVVGCGASKPAVQGPSAATTPATSVPETRDQAAKSGAVRIAQDILHACGMSDADAYFAFDSSKLESKDIRPLNTVATCFTSGALRGRSVKLVGRADPRGAGEYNLTLGQARADAVAGYLDAKGMVKGKTETTSRGAMDATGHDEAGWTRDRRVDLMLGD